MTDVPAQHVFGSLQDKAEVTEDVGNGSDPMWKREARRERFDRAKNRDEISWSTTATSHNLSLWIQSIVCFIYDLFPLLLVEFRG
jgi:hypothetical protein